MKHFILNTEPDFHPESGNLIRLEGGDYHYLVRVRRLTSGECFNALLPSGDEVIVQIVSINENKKTLTCKCTASINTAEASSLEDSSLPRLILMQALPKGDKMDLIVRQAAEGGINEIVPFVSEYSMVKINDGQKFSRWERIIKEARQQSGSKTATFLHKPLKINGLIEYWNEVKETADCNAAGLLFHHQQGLEQKSLHGYLYNNPKIVVLAVGPEGGFSGTEVSVFMENGFFPVKIGSTVFRTETAALYCAAAVKIILLERESWEFKTTN